MREIILSSCTSDSPLAQQLTENIPGFNWHRDQNGPLVTKSEVIRRGKIL